jgi:cystathionine beta-lyase/cystathionine gamma-synthase
MLIAIRKARGIAPSGLAAITTTLLSVPKAGDHVLLSALAQFRPLWRRDHDFTGVSGLFSIVLKPVPQKAFDALLDAVKLLGMGYSWGGFESLKADLDRGFAALKAAA